MDDKQKILNVARAMTLTWMEKLKEEGKDEILNYCVKYIGKVTGFEREPTFDECRAVIEYIEEKYNGN